jgi:hypothetical protein
MKRSWIVLVAIVVVLVAGLQALPAVADDVPLWNGRTAQEWEQAYIEELSESADWQYAATAAKAETAKMRGLAYIRLKRNKLLTMQLRRTYFYDQQLEAACVVVTGKKTHPKCVLADRIIRCEAAGNVTEKPSPTAKNPSSTAAGYGQWLDSTWAGTVFGRAGVSVYNGFANAVAVVQWVYRGGAYVHWLASAGCWG